MNPMKHIDIMLLNGSGGQVLHDAALPLPSVLEGPQRRDYGLCPEPLPFVAEPGFRVVY